MFLDFQKNMNKNYDAYRASIIGQTEKLKSETEAYSRAVSKFSASINDLSQRANELVNTNNSFVRELQSVSFAELSRINESLNFAKESFRNAELAFINSTQSTTRLLSGLSNIQRVFMESGKNLESVASLNSNLDELVRKFKEAVVQMELVSRSIASASETKIQPILDEMRNLLPAIRNDASSVSADLFARFSDSLDVLQKVSSELNKITVQYNMLLSGNRKDPVSGEFM
jgi:DnaJ-domain-containing protein 1